MPGRIRGRAQVTECAQDVLEVLGAADLLQRALRRLLEDHDERVALWIRPHPLQAASISIGRNAESPTPSAPSPLLPTQRTFESTSIRASSLEIPESPTANPVRNPSPRNTCKSCSIRAGIERDSGGIRVPIRARG